MSGSESSKKAKAKWLANNREKRKEVGLAYYYRNRVLAPPRVLVDSPTAIKCRRYRKENVQFMLAGRLRVVVNRALKRQFVKKSVRTLESIGCSPEFLRNHIEIQFVRGMTWETIHVDHWVPLSAFDLRDREEELLACNWKNLRPLLPHANMSKNDSLPSPLPSWLPAHIAARILERSHAKAK